MQCLLSCRVQGEMKSFSKFWKEIAEIGAWVCGEVFFQDNFFSLLFAEEKPPTAFIHPLSSASLFTRAEL